MFIFRNKSGLTLINEVKNMPDQTTTVIAEFEATTESYKLFVLAFALIDPTLWATGGGVVLRVLVDDLTVLEMKSEFSDLKRPTNLFMDIKQRQKVTVELDNITGLTIAECAIKLDFMV